MQTYEFKPFTRTEDKLLSIIKIKSSICLRHFLNKILLYLFLPCRKVFIIDGSSASSKNDEPLNDSLQIKALFNYTCQQN